LKYNIFFYNNHYYYQQYMHIKYLKLVFYFDIFLLLNMSTIVFLMIYFVLLNICNIFLISQFPAFFIWHFLVNTLLHSFLPTLWQVYFILFPSLEIEVQHLFWLHLPDFDFKVSHFFCCKDWTWKMTISNYSFWY